MHSKHSSMNTGIGRDAITKREIDLTLYKVEGKLSTSVSVSRASRALGGGDSLSSGLRSGQNTKGFPVSDPSNASFCYLLISDFVFQKSSVIQESHHER